MFKTDKRGHVICFGALTVIPGTGWTIRPPSLLLFNLHGCSCACKILLFWASSISYSVCFSTAETWGPGHGGWTAVAFRAPVKSGPLTCKSSQCSYSSNPVEDPFPWGFAQTWTSKCEWTYSGNISFCAGSWALLTPVKCSANESTDFQGLAWSQGDSRWHSSID